MACPSRSTIIAALIAGNMIVPGFCSRAGATTAVSDLRITGRVMRADGAAAAGARIQLYPISSLFTRARLLLDGGTVDPVVRSEVDDGGWYSISAPHAGLWTVRAESPGFVAMEYRLLPLTEATHLVDVELPFDRGVTVKVRDGDGVPIDGATVRLKVPEARRPLVRTYPIWQPAPRDGTTAEEGAITLSRAESESLILTAATPGYLLHTMEHLRGPVATLTMARGRRRVIEVRTADDAPAAGVLVAGGGSLHPLGLTDGQGRMSVPLPAGHGLELTVLSADGRSLHSRMEAPGREDAPPFRLTLPPSVTIAGRVIDRLTRQPLAGAIVWPQDEPWAGVVTDRAGRFSLVHAGQGVMTLTAGETGYLRAQPLRGRPAGAGIEPPVIALQPAAVVAGTAVDGDGAPVAGALLTLAVMRTGRDRYYFPNPWETPPTARSDAQGRFRLAPVDPAHDYFVTAQSERYAPATAGIVGLEPHLPANVRLVLTPGQVVTGMVLDADEHPLNGAAITLVPSPRQAMRQFGNYHLLERGEPLEGTSDAEGRFAIAGVPPGPHDVTVRHEGFATLHSARHEVAESAARHDLGTFTLVPGETLRGRLIDGGDLPVAGAEIHVDSGALITISPMEATSGRTPAATSGPDGWFAIDDLRPGSQVDLRVSRDGYVPLSAPGVFVPQIEPLILTMQRAVRVAGVVVDADDDPIAGADVTLYRRREGGGGNSMYFYIDHQDAQSDSDGRFLIEDVEPGRVTVTASAAGYRETRIEGLEVPRDDPPEDLAITLNRGATLTGKVTTADRQPCIGAWVKKLSTRADRHLETGPPSFTDGGGNFRIDGLSPGPISIEATLSGHTRAVEEIDLHVGINEIHLVLGEGRTVAGMVTDLSGGPIANASVQLRPPGQNWSRLAAESGQDGTFSIEGVEDGEFIQIARADGFAPYTHDGRILIAGESIRGLTIVMEPAASIVGKVSGVDPAELPLIRLNVGGPGAWYDGIGVDHEGGYRVGNLTTGEYRVTASLEGRGTQVSNSVAIETGMRDVRLDLEFGEGLALGGRALVGSRPVGGASIFMMLAGGRRAGWGRTDHEGRFRIEGLEPDTYTLQLRQFETGLVHADEILLESSRDIEIHVPVARVGGLVVDAATSTPLQGVRADLEPAAFGGDASASYLLSRTTTTDSTGRFSVENLSSGAWTAAFSRPGYASRSIEIQLGADGDRDDLEVELSPTEGMSINIRLASGRYPDAVRVAALDANGGMAVHGSFSTGVDGRVHLSSLPPGRWEILLATGGAATTAIEVTTPGAPLSVTLGPPTTLEISLPDLAPDDPPATLLLVDASGRPFRSLGWDGTPRSHWTIGHDGSEFQTLPAGTWTIRAQDAGGTTWESIAITTPGSTTRVELK